MNALAWLTILTQGAPVPVAAPPPRVHVVLVGIRDYANSEILPRTHAENDARALHDLVVDNRYLGVDKENIRILLGRDASRRNILQTLDWLRRRAEPDDTVIFGFLGRGVTLNEWGDRIGYLTHDSSLKNRRHDTITSAEIADVLDRLRSRRVCVLLDVAFTGFRTNESIALPRLDDQSYREFLGGHGSEGAEPLPGRVVLAMRGLTGSFDLEKHGLFTRVVLDGLRGGAASGDSLVTSRGLGVYLEEHLPILARREGKTDHERGQKPLVLAVKGPSFRLSGNQAARRRHAPTRHELSRELAEGFAAHVLEACTIIESGYWRKEPLDRLLTLGTVGIFERLGESIPVELLRRLTRLKELNRADQTRFLADLRQQLGKREDLDAPDDVEQFVDELLRGLDPTCQYISTTDRPIVCGFGQRLGVGLTLRKNAATDLAEVVTALPNSPSRRAGLLPDDVILTLKWQTDSEGRPLPEAETISTRECSLDECANRLLGKGGTRITLGVRRRGEARPRELVLTRSLIVHETVLGHQREADGSWDHIFDAKNRIAYVRITHFARGTAEELRGVLLTLRKSRVKGLVLDLRFNPGGLLSSTVDVAGLFLKDAPVVSIEARDQPCEVMRCRGEDILSGIPLVALINEETRFSGEILAACLQDHKRASIVGSRSRGVGAVQNICSCRGDELKTTFAVFLRPNGTCLHRLGAESLDWGVTPDKGGEVALSRLEREELHDGLRRAAVLTARNQPRGEFKDTQLEKALEFLEGKLTRQ